MQSEPCSVLDQGYGVSSRPLEPGLGLRSGIRVTDQSYGRIRVTDGSGLRIRVTDGSGLESQISQASCSL